MRDSPKRSVRSRQYVLGLVGMAVVLVLAAKQVHGPAARSSAPVIPQDSGGGAAAQRADLAAVDRESGLHREEKDSYPDRAPEQVQWALRYGHPAMILFHSTMCRPCRMMDALVQIVRRDYEPTVVFIEVLIDDPANAEVILWAKVGSIPASYFLSSTGEGRRIVGLMKQADLRQELADLLSQAQTY